MQKKFFSCSAMMSKSVFTPADTLAFNPLKITFVTTEKINTASLTQPRFRLDFKVK